MKHSIDVRSLLLNAPGLPVASLAHSCRGARKKGTNQLRREIYFSCCAYSVCQKHWDV